MEAGCGGLIRKGQGVGVWIRSLSFAQTSCHGGQIAKNLFTSFFCLILRMNKFHFMC